MRFDVDKSDLFKELQNVQGVVERKTTVPILSNLLLEADEGRLLVTATDLDVTVRCSTQAKIETGGSMAVSARKLFDIVRLLPDDSIHVESGDEGWVHLTCQRSKFKIATLTKDNFPEIPSFQGDTVALPASALRYMINRTIFAVTQEESRYALNGGLMKLESGKLALVATDGHRLAMIEREVDLGTVEEEVRILVPKKTLVELSKMTEDLETVEFGHSENHLFFGLGERSLVSRLLTGQFPNYQMVIPKDNNRRATLNTSELSAALKRVQVMSDEQSRGIRFLIAPSELRVSSANADFGEAQESLSAEYADESVDIAFNSQYLLDFLAGLSAAEVHVDLKDSETQGLLSPKDDGEYTYQYVVMPMKI